MKAPATPLPAPPWLAPLPPIVEHHAGTPLVLLVVAIVIVLVALCAAILIRRLWASLAKHFNWRNPMSDKLDALTAAVASLEVAVSVNSADIALAAQMFKDNAAASVQLAADEAVIAALTDRVNAAKDALVADDASLKATTTPAV